MTDRYKVPNQPPSYTFAPRLRITLRAAAALWTCGEACIHAYKPSGEWLQTWYYPRARDTLDGWSRSDILTFTDWLNERECR